MRHLTLQKLPDFDEYEIVKGQIGVAPEGGFDLEGIRMSLRIAEALEGSDRASPVPLEEKDYAYLQTRMRSARWAVADHRLLDLVERCLNAPTS